MTLYEMTEQWMAVLSLAEEGADPQAIKDTLEAIQGEIEDKADGYAKVIKQLIGEAEIVKAEKERLCQREQSLKNSAADMKKRLEEVMVQTGKRKFKTELFSFGIQANAPSAEIEDEVRFMEWADKNAPDLIRTKREINKAELLEQLKAGRKVKYAAMKQTESLRIR